MSNNLEFFRNKHFKNKQDKEIYQAFYDFCKNKEPEGDYYYRFGYEALGIVLYKFCLWIMERAKQEKLTQLFFLSREGKLIKQAFELLPEHDLFNCKYLYVSRRSLRVPIIHLKKYSRYQSIFPTRYISIRDLIFSIGLDPKEFEVKALGLGISLDSVIKGSDIENNNIINCFLDDIWDKVESNSKNEYCNAISYLESQELDSHFAVIDVGWRGSMQHYLNIVLDSANMNNDITGFYLVLSSDLIKGIDSNAFLNKCLSNSEGCDLLRGYAGLVEALFLCEEGSTIKYEKAENGIINPVLEKSEYMINESLSLEGKAVKSVQKGALDFIFHYINSGEKFINECSNMMTFYNLNSLGAYPRLLDVKMFSCIKLYNNGSLTPLSARKPIRYYVFHPNRFKMDFYASRWRIGFMKNLMKIPLPYNTIMNIIMKIHKG